MRGERPNILNNRATYPRGEDEVSEHQLITEQLSLSIVTEEIPAFEQKIQVSLTAKASA